jgi:excisionase family DNA binding protein
MRDPEKSVVLHPRLITVEDVAGQLGVNVRHVRRLVQERRLPYIKWGRLLRFDPEDVLMFMDEHRAGRTA